MTGSYAEIGEPKPITAFDDATKLAARLIKPKPILYTSMFLSWLQPFQSGWSTAQMNLSQYNDTDECNALRTEENFNGNCIFMILGGVVQASVSNIWAFAVGRLISGLASGTATGTIGAYVNELSPPHMRNTLGLGLQIFTTLGILVPAICFFFANTSNGWRYLAAFPCILAVIYLTLAPSMTIESPAWLLTKGRTEEAKQVIANLYGEEHVNTAMSWLEVNKPHAEEGSITSRESMFDPRYRMQLFGGLLLSCAQQLSGINAVFYYSGAIFSDAGISDSRIGTLIINFINIWPAFVTARNMILWGLAGMVVMAVGMTVANARSAGVGDDGRHIPGFDPSERVVIVHRHQLVVQLDRGVAYPYISDALGDYAYVPFVVLLIVFYLLALNLVPETSGKSAEEILAEYDSRGIKYTSASD
ncbi:Major facilitator superfamily domain [Phytophthora cactorum]|nr:Major facilitator superfamily domain [Phytophthora cactorum]